MLSQIPITPGKMQTDFKLKATCPFMKPQFGELWKEAGSRELAEKIDFWLQKNIKKAD